MKSREHESPTPRRPAASAGRSLRPPPYGIEHADAVLPERRGITARENAAVLALSGGRVDLHAVGASVQRVPSHHPRLQAVGARSLAQGREALVSRAADRGHELWHLAQQAMGRVQADSVEGGQPLNTRPALEREADAMSARISSFSGPVLPSTAVAPIASPAPAPIQRTPEEERIRRRKAQFKHTPSAEEYREKRRERAEQERKERRAQRLMELRTRGIGDTSEPEYIEQSSEFEPRSMDIAVPEEGEQEEDLSIEELISAFEQLRLSFEDKDGEQHEVYIDPEAGDLIVESNPTPLKTILKDKKWEKIALSAKDVADLTNAQSNIDSALKAFATSRAKISGQALRKELLAAATILEKLSQIPIPPTDLTKSLDYGQNTGKVEGSHVIASPLSPKSATGGFGPLQESRLTAAIRKAAPGNEGSSYIRMHLLNDNVFGPGQLWNLTPGPSASNVRMEKTIEDPLKRAILDKGVIMRFEAEVDYPKPKPWQVTDSEIDQNPNKYRFQKITFKAQQWVANSSTKKYAPGAAVDPEIAQINNKTVSWDWGSLTPLVPKPKILSTTDKDELVDVGIPKASAEKIVAFNVAATGFTLTGRSNKEDQLADAIHDWEVSQKGGKPRKIDLKGKANAVLWQ